MPLYGNSVTTSRFRPPRGDGGYAVLLAIFMVATMLLLAATATPNILTQGQRLREQDAIWRANQYVRAIRLYYQKNRKYPSNLDDLTKANADGVHFLRKAYKDPMNSSDGSWRVIYVTLPSGQLVGSVHYHSLQELAGGNVAGFAGQLLGQMNQGLNGGTQSVQRAAQPGQLNGLQSDQFGQTALGGQNSQNSTVSSTQPAALNAVDSPVFGDFVIGVASKVKQPSIIVYQGSMSYFEWEFIWNPLTNGGGVANSALNASSLQGGAPNLGLPPGGANGNNNIPGSIPLAPQRDPGPQQVPGVSQN